MCISLTTDDFTDPGVTGHKHQLRRAGGSDSEGGEQGVDLACAPVQFFGNNRQWDVLFAKRKLVDATGGLPGSKTAPEIDLEATRGLVAVLSRLGEQLHDDRRDGRWDVGRPVDGRGRLPGQMAMNPFHWIGCYKR